MDTLVVPCHACGSNNPVSESHCGNPNCNAVLFVRLVTTTQILPSYSEETDPELVAQIKMVREAYLVAGSLLLEAYRLNALLQMMLAERKRSADRKR
jgi:hypothetical protein